MLPRFDAEPLALPGGTVLRAALPALQLLASLLVGCLVLGAALPG